MDVFLKHFQVKHFPIRLPNNVSIYVLYQCVSTWRKILFGKLNCVEVCMNFRRISIRSSLLRKFKWNLSFTNLKNKFFSWQKNWKRWAMRCSTLWWKCCKNYWRVAKLSRKLCFQLENKAAHGTHEFFTRNAGYNSWNNWGTWALASKSSSYRLFDSWSSIQSSVCTLHYAICRFSILSFPFSPTSFLFHSRHRRNSLFIINFLIPWTFTQFPFTCLRVPVFPMFSASVVFTFWIYFSFASFNIFFFPVIPDRLCLQPSFILSSKRNASNCKKVLIFPTFFVHCHEFVVRYLTLKSAFMRCTRAFFFV